MSEEIDYDLLVDSIDMDQLAELIAQNIAQNLDEESVASHLDINDIAGEIPLDELAGEIPLDDLAGEFDLYDLSYEIYSNHIDMDGIYDHCVESLDMDAIHALIDYDDLANAVCGGSVAESLNNEQLEVIAEHVNSKEVAKHVADPWSLMVTPFSAN